MKRWILALMMVVGVSVVHAQFYSTSNGKAVKQYEKGINLIAVDPEGAVKCMEQALKYDPKFVEVWLTLGDMRMEWGQWDEAERCYEEFLKLDKKHQDWRSEAEHNVECIRFRRTAMQNPVPYHPKNMGNNINSKFDEYLPALTVDGSTLVFTRRVPRNQYTTANTQEEEDFYVSMRQSDGSWGKAMRMEEPINSTDNEGAQCISQDGRIMFFTGCGRYDGMGRCDLYMSINKGGKWSNPRNLGPDVNTGGWESQPSFSIDGKTLYFVSNRKGGYGGMDIWKVVFEKGKWGTPKNLGPTINTKGDEASPFIHYDDNTLYFSSTGHVGMGGTDLFMSRRQEDGSWGEPQNLGYPINTEGDEGSIIVSADGKMAIFASDKLNGVGKLDLYYFELPQTAQPIMTICMKGRVSDEKSGNSVAANVSIIDLKSGKEVANTSSDGVSGSYIVSLPAQRNYAVNVNAKGYLFYSQNVNLAEGLKEGFEWKPVVTHIQLKPIEMGESVALRNVFFETGKYDLLAASQVELEKVYDLMEKNATLKIELGGHTDNVGGDAMNMTLSEQRAKAVYDWLVAKGIDASRLSYKGYGATQPIADNSTPEGREQNRRTVFMIVEK